MAAEVVAEMEKSAATAGPGAPLGGQNTPTTKKLFPAACCAVTRTAPGEAASVQL